MRDCSESKLYDGQLVTLKLYVDSIYVVYYYVRQLAAGGAAADAAFARNTTILSDSLEDVLVRALLIIVLAAVVMVMVWGRRNTIEDMPPPVRETRHTLRLCSELDRGVDWTVSSWYLIDRMAVCRMSGCARTFLETIDDDQTVVEYISVASRHHNRRVWQSLRPGPADDE